MEKFNKREFARFINKRLGLSQQEAQRLFDAIGEELKRTLESGGTAYAFGVGTLKVVRSQGTGNKRRVRLRLNPSTERMLQAMSATNVGIDSSDEANSREDSAELNEPNPSLPIKN